MSEEDRPYSLAPRIVLIADGAFAAAQGERVITLVGGQTGGAVPVDRAVAALDTALDIDAVLLLIDQDGGTALDGLLDRLDHAAREGRYPSVVRLPSALIDQVTARIQHQNVTLLCDPNKGELFAALAAALASRLPTAPMMTDRDPEPMRLRQLSEEVERIARTLAALSGDDGGGGAALFQAPPEGEAAEPIAAATVRASIRARRMRDQHFAAELFADPAWDMMLDLLAARLEGRQVAVSSLCIAAAVPATTALRWIKRLTDVGMFRRIADPRDGRRVFIELSEASADALARYFTALTRSGLFSS